ncbi:MAG: hypothetical protein JNM30_11045 [Rhodospirillales bacterium]|nr:hypothetical protein [Rhodospirillales bacterium]
MARMHLVAAEIASDAPCRFRFQLEQSDGRAASLALDVPFSAADSGGPDVGRIFAAARAELVSTLLGAFTEACRLDDGLVPRQAQAAPNSATTLDLRRTPAANDDHRARAFRAGGTS